jgi:hypothetical protein
VPTTITARAGIATLRISLKIRSGPLTMTSKESRLSQKRKGKECFGG